MRTRLQTALHFSATALRSSTAMLALLGASLVFSCAPPTPAQKASEAARELNMAARWGRMDEAMQRTSDKDRPDFLKRRAEWHAGVRIMETELTALDMKDGTHASIQVDVSWMFDDDPTLRVTRLAQEWSDAEGSWTMMKEERISGDLGLFGEEVKRLDKTPDRHFPSTTIR